MDHDRLTTEIGTVPASRGRMGSRVFFRRYAGILLVAFSLVAVAARALIVDLDAFVDNAITGPDGITPLADGSLVYIIGSSNNLIDPPISVGTNIIGDSVTGDDIILGIVRIGDNSISNSGTFFTTVQFESDEINYVYIRFFDSPGPLTGSLYWGTSTIFQLGITVGVATVQFDQPGDLSATNQNNFVIIPEPSTLNLFVVVAGMLWTIRRRMQATGAPGAESGASGDQADEPGPA
jgi:hypothetical protein